MFILSHRFKENNCYMLFCIKENGALVCPITENGDVLIRPIEGEEQMGCKLNDDMAIIEAPEPYKNILPFEKSYVSLTPFFMAIDRNFKVFSAGCCGFSKVTIPILNHMFHKMYTNCLGLFADKLIFKDSNSDKCITMSHSIIRGSGYVGFYNSKWDTISIPYEWETGRTYHDNMSDKDIECIMMEFGGSTLGICLASDVNEETSTLNPSVLQFIPSLVLPQFLRQIVDNISTCCYHCFFEYSDAPERKVYESLSELDKMKSIECGTE